jgi:AcrR family transcriptional regulator
VGRPDTRSALLEQGALLFARHGVGGVSVRQLHEAVGARNESAVQYHFGDKRQLALEIIRLHVAAVEARRAPLVDAIADAGQQHEVRPLVHALAAPMAADLTSPLGRAHLRLVAQLNHPALAYEQPFRDRDTPSGTSVVRWLAEATADLPGAIRRERLAALREQLIGLFGARAVLRDERGDPADGVDDEVFLANLVDVLVAGLTAEVSAESLEAVARARGRRSRA